MNLIDHVVIDIKSKPYKSKFFDKELWHIDVLADTYGSIQKSTLTFETEIEAKNLKIGYKFQA